jgi:hypothetical protein
LNAASSGSSTGEWKPSVTGTELLVESGATYQASYPIEYSGIRADQRKADGEDYRLSNLLETPEKVTIGRDGTLSFTGESAFVHKGVKLTLKFSGKNTLSKDFTSMTVTGTPEEQARMKPSTCITPAVQAMRNIPGMALSPRLIPSSRYGYR